MFRDSLLVVFITLGGVLGFGNQSLAVQTVPPNIVILLADDLGFSDLGCYGGEIRTPHLDRLAENGLRYTNFYNCGRCWPTRAALMTGYYPHQVRRDQLPNIPSGGGGIRPRWAKLLPTMLAAVGYRCYHAGKWHIDGNRLSNGFSHSYSLEDHDRYFGPRAHLYDDKRLPEVDGNTPYYATTTIADHALRMLDEHCSNYAGQPFFQFVCFTAPHFPLQAPADDIDRYKETYKSGWEEVRSQRYARQRELGIVGCELSPIEPEVGPPYHFPAALEKLGKEEVNRPVPWANLSPEQQSFQANKMAIHAAMVDRMDQEVGRIVAKLEQHGVLQDTLLLFLSDNGASAEMMVRGDGHNRDAAGGGPGTFLCLGPGWSSVANTPFRRHKTWVHEGGIATPLIVHWPQRITEPGGLRHVRGHVIDIVPTILELVRQEDQQALFPQEGAPASAGRSLAPTISVDQPIERDMLWWLHEGNRAIVIDDWKLVAANNQRWELYDLNNDRSESHDLIRDMPQRADKMMELWQQKFDQIQKDASVDL